jgi:NAD(P)-dependent dehydrogenase (short-subunit alcohol dehydrogenase family)
VSDPMTLLRHDVLAGRRVALSGSVDASVAELLVHLGASLDDREEPPHALVHDGGGAFGAGGEDGLAAALQDAWDAVASAAPQSMIPAGHGGKVVLIAPRSGGGRYADAARAGLENLARTLSIEWARYGITVTAIAPGRTTREADVALLVAFLLSDAGGYYSGCRFEFGAVEPPRGLAG